MKRRVYRVQPGKDGGWWLEWPRPGGKKLSRTKKCAVNLGRVLARLEWKNLGNLSQLVIHGRDGKIQTEHTYGRDPARYPG